MPLADRHGIRLWLTLRALSRSPWLLTAILLVLNAALMPYLGLIHDAQIYSGLVLNRIDPEFLQGDLFFQYGSQDQFSLFSPLMTPAVRLLGLKTAFFLGYVANLGFLFAALVRLAGRLWPESPAAVVGLIYLAIVPVVYGGCATFHIVEPFLSPRLPACALTLWSIADFLDGRRFRGSLCLAAAFALHPLMALPGMIIVALMAIGKFSAFVAIAAVAVPTIAFSIAHWTVSERVAGVLGRFDADWLEWTMMTNRYQFPFEWSGGEWFGNVFALAGLFASGWMYRRTSPQRARLLLAAATVGALGIAGSVVVTQLPYALPIKGQPYRWLWFPIALAPCALLDLAWVNWRTNLLIRRLVSVAIVAGLGVTTFIPLEFAVLLAAAFPLFVLATIYRKDWNLVEKISASLLGSVLVGLAGWSLLRAGIFSVVSGMLAERVGIVGRYSMIVAALGTGIGLLGILTVLALSGRRLRHPRVAVALLAVAFVMQTGLFAWTQTQAFQDRLPRSSDVEFVDNFLDAHRGNSKKPVCVYSNFGNVAQYWVEWKTRSYYDHCQLAGFVFNRETAAEGKRRVQLVAPFEAAALRKDIWHVTPESTKEHIEAWFERFIEDAAPPTEADLLRLAADPAIDYIVLFDGHVDRLACAKKGNVSIYDCKTLRQIVAAWHRQSVIIASQ